MDADAAKPLDAGKPGQKTISRAQYRHLMTAPRQRRRQIAQDIAHAANFAAGEPAVLRREHQNPFR
jgi:hypothetical protein